jgi:transposase-like protein
MFLGKKRSKGENRMARKSNDSELKQTWQAAAASGDDGMRALVERGVQQVLEAEMTSLLAAAS